MYELVLLRFE